MISDPERTSCSLYMEEKAKAKCLWSMSPGHGEWIWSPLPIILAPRGCHPRVMLMQGRAPGKAESLASHQAGRQKLGLRRKEVSFRICTPRTLPFLLWPHLQPPCAGSSSCFDSRLTKQSTSHPPQPLHKQQALTPLPNS